MRLHRAPTVTALLLAATLTLAACSDDEPREPEPSPTSTGTTAAPTPSPSAEPTGPSPSAEPTEPVLPEAAKEPTEAGARAFITYYWDLINYAQLTGDVKALRRSSASSCRVCAEFVDDLRRLYSEGGRLEGGQNTIGIAEVGRLSVKDEDVHGFRLDLTVTHDDQVIVSGDGNRDDRRSGEDRFTAYLMWADGRRWRTDALDLR